MSNTEKLMSKYPMLAAAWNECTQIWEGIEQDGTVHKFNRRILLSDSMESKSECTVDDRFLGGKDKMITWLQTYFNDFKYKSLTAEMFKAHFIKHFGEVDVDWNNWLYIFVCICIQYDWMRSKRSVVGNDRSQLDS